MKKFTREQILDVVDKVLMINSQEGRKADIDIKISCDDIGNMVCVIAYRRGTCDSIGSKYNFTAPHGEEMADYDAMIEFIDQFKEERIYETTDIKAVAECAGDTKPQRAVLVHEKADKFGNGDCILFGYSSEDFENDSDVLAALQNENPESDFSIDESGIYHA